MRFNQFRHSLVYHVKESTFSGELRVLYDSQFVFKEMALYEGGGIGRYSQQGKRRQKSLEGCADNKSDKIMRTQPRVGGV